MQEAARLVSNLQTESDGVDLMTLLRETPVKPTPSSSSGCVITPDRPPARRQDPTFALRSPFSNPFP